MNNIDIFSPIYKLNYTINKNDIYIKREDLIPFSFGGNKVRKAKLFFEEIESNKHDYVVTYGSSSSNHSRVIANMAKSKGINCTIISIEGNNHTFNSKLVKMFQTNVILTKVERIKNTINFVMNDLMHKGYNPYFIQGGGHGFFGTKAYVDVYKEIILYSKENNIDFDNIFLASGTGTTQAGLVIGSLLNNDNINIIGISIGRKRTYGRQVISESIYEYLSKTKQIFSKNIINDKIKFLDDYLLDGYGSYNEEIIKTISNVLNKEGINLDTTYTGKAFWGMSEYINKNNIQNKKILFIHTGGTPLFFTDLGRIMK